MDSASSEIASYAVGKCDDYLVESFRHHVIEPWSRRRAEQFFLAFVAGIADATMPTADIQATLTAILNDEAKTEVLFEAYRTVCLSKSKTVGPRAIGLLTAQIISEKRIATGFEERWFEVYESCTDFELADLSEFYGDEFAKARGEKDEKYKIKFNHLVVEWARDDSNFKGDVDRSPLNLHEVLGSWAAKLERLGMIRVEAEEKVWDYREDSERHIDEPGTARRITYRLYLDLPDEEYAALIRKAQPTA
jgi:hypothetical protein